jgi:TolB-like protein/Tfp pilus assembly protein PilF
MWYNLSTVLGPGARSRDSFLDAAVIRQLDAILASPALGGAERRGRLLKYLVEKALAGQPVKEYGIGVDVFAKPADYDPRLDPSVRVEIGRLRARLQEYYSFAGTGSEIRIQIPKGSYVPVFEPLAREPAPLALPEPQPTKPGSKITSIGAMIGAALAVLIVALWLGAYSGRPPGINSVVVLPFANLTGDPRNEYLADGVTEQLTDSLAHVSALRVVARTSAFQFKGKNADIRDIGRKVDAEAVVEGSLANTDGKLRLTVQVNRSRDGYHIFSRAFEGGPHDLARLENEMAAPVLAVIRPRASIDRKAERDPEAYDLFLKARAFRGDGTRAASDQALAYLHQAIERDPTYADAYAALAGVYASDALNFAADPMEYANQAKAAASKALELDPGSSAAYSALGVVDSLVLLDWKRGEEELRKSIALMPQYAAAHGRLGSLLSAQGRFPQAIAELQKAAGLDPLIAAPRVTLGLAYFMSRNYDQALRLFTQARDLHPEALVVHSFVGLAWEGKGQFDRALEEYKIVEASSEPAARVFVAHLLAVTGKRPEALALLQQMEHPAGGESPNAFDIAAVYTALGDKDAAFHWLDRAYEQRMVWFLKVHPFLDPLRSDPRFAALLKKAGLG